MYVLKEHVHFSLLKVYIMYMFVKLTADIVEALLYKLILGYNGFPMHLYFKSPLQMWSPPTQERLMMALLPRF